jgi:hypothetical protein
LRNASRKLLRPTGFGLQNLLAQTQALRRHFHQLVFGDEFNRLFQVHHPVRNQAQGFIGTGSAHVGQLLLADNIHVQIVVAGVLADNHAFVDFNSGANQQNAAILQAMQRVGGGDALTVADQRPEGRCGISPWYGM